MPEPKPEQRDEVIEKLSEQGIDSEVEALETKKSGTPADAVLREVIKKEISSKIRESFRLRHIVEETQGEAEKPKKSSVVEFDYLRHHLLLSDILDKVTEKGILGTVKKKWAIILEEIQGELSQLYPESRQAIEESIKKVFEKKQRIEEFIKNTDPNEIFSELIGDGKKHELKGKMRIKTLGNILTVYLPNPVDFAKVYNQSAEAMEADIKESSKVGGFAHKRNFKQLDPDGDLDLVVFPREPQEVFKSTLSHEVAHRINDRLFEEKSKPFEQTKRSDFSEPKKLFEDVFNYWSGDAAKDELYNQALSGLMHYDQSPTWDINKVLSKHVDEMLKQGKKAFYDYPARDKQEILDKAKELFPEVDPKFLENLYQEYASKYYGFIAKRIELIKTSFVKLKTQWARYDFLDLLRFEDAQKWSRTLRFLENIGRNFDSLGGKYQEHYADYFMGQIPDSGNEELIRIMKELWEFAPKNLVGGVKKEDITAKDKLFKGTRFGSNVDIQTMNSISSSEDYLLKAIILMRWVMLTHKLSLDLIGNFREFGEVTEGFKKMVLERRFF